MVNYAMMTTDKLLTVTEACELLQIAPSTLRRAGDNGKIRIVRTPGGRRRVPMSEVLRLLEQDDKEQSDEAAHG